MQIFNQIEDWRTYRRQLAPQKTLGFVPTMGNLHRGHASLFARSKQEQDFTAVSIFVNPTQFNRADDFQHYPRTLEADLALLEQAGVDFCLLPSEEAMYADGYRYQLQETELCQLMEGKHRPGHFNGVLTIVMKLLNWVKPHCAYFGEKDYQQYLLIQNMVTAFFMDIIIKACPIIREASGLAYSSRNNRLTPTERSKAEKFARLFQQPSQSCAQIQAALEANHIQVDYLEEYANRRYVAVMIGTIRLIDNYLLKI